jgi:hypothetical protein
MKMKIESFAKFNPLKFIRKMTTQECDYCKTTVPFWMVSHSFGERKCLCSSCSDIGVREDECPAGQNLPQTPEKNPHAPTIILTAIAGFVLNNIIGIGMTQSAKVGLIAGTANAIFLLVVLSYAAKKIDAAPLATDPSTESN